MGACVKRSAEFRPYCHLPNYLQHACRTPDCEGRWHGEGESCGAIAINGDEYYCLKRVQNCFNPCDLKTACPEVLIQFVSRSRLWDARIVEWSLILRMVSVTLISWTLLRIVVGEGRGRSLHAIEGIVDAAVTTIGERNKQRRTRTHFDPHLNSIFSIKVTRCVVVMGIGIAVYLFVLFGTFRLCKQSCCNEVYRSGGSVAGWVSDG